MPDIAALGIAIDSRSAKQAAKDLKDLEAAGSGAEKGIGGMAMQFGLASAGASELIGAAKAIAGAMIELGKQSIEVAAAYETSRITYGVLVQDMEAGVGVFDKLREFAAKTPLAFAEIDAAAQTLLGFGTTSEDLVDVLGQLGDVARGDGAKLGNLALVYGQVQAQGKAMTQDLYQFVNAGVPIFKALASSMGVSEAQIKDLTAAGKIGFPQIQAALKDLTGEGGMYYGMMDKIADTTQGKWSTAQDNFKDYLASLGDKFLPAVNAALDLFNESMERLADQKAFKGALEGKGGLEQYETALKMAREELVKVQEEEARFKKALLNADPRAVKYLEEGLKNVTARLYDATQQVAQLTTQYDELFLAEAERNAESKKAAAAKLEAEKKAAAEANREADRLDKLKKAEEERIARAKAMTDYIEGLKEEYDKLALTEEERLVKQLDGLKATEAERELVNGLVADIDRLKTAREEEAEAAKKAEKDAAAAAAKKVQQEEEVASVLAEVTDAMRTHGLGTRELYELRLRDAGATEEQIAAGLEYYDTLQKMNAAQEEGNKSKADAEALTKRMDDALKSVGESLKSLGMDAYIDGFRALGAAFYDGADGADTFATSMAQIGKAILDQLPMILLQAGVNLLGTPAWPTGLALIAASGLVAIGAGAADAASTKNAHGNAYDESGLVPFAKGGVVSSPTLFKFAQGTGLMGEAGPEAILPLERGANGDLGVKASMTPVQVIINNNAAGVTATAQEGTGSDGGKAIIVTIEKVVQGMVPSGKLDGLLARGGVKPSAVRV